MAAIAIPISVGVNLLAMGIGCSTLSSSPLHSSSPASVDCQKDVARVALVIIAILALVLGAIGQFPWGAPVPEVARVFFCIFGGGTILLALFCTCISCQENPTVRD